MGTPEQDLARYMAEVDEAEARSDAVQERVQRLIDDGMAETVLMDAEVEHTPGEDFSEEAMEALEAEAERLLEKERQDCEDSRAEDAYQDMLDCQRGLY